MTTTTDGAAPAPLPLLVLGHGRDLASERGVECPGDLPAPSDPGLVERARAAKAALGDRVFVLGHHYQRDEVIEFADVTGDSFKLAKEAAARPDARVHRLLRRALHGRVGRHPHRRHRRPVVLPDLAAGCSMADMAAIDQVEDALGRAGRGLGVADVTVPVTYMNSSAAIKAFTGRHGGTVCTSVQRQDGADRGRFDQRGGVEGRQGAVPARPAPRPQHRRARPRAGRSTDCVVCDPHRPSGGLTPEQLRDAR